MVIADLDPRKRGSLEEQFVAIARRMRDERIASTFVFSRPPCAAVATLLAEAGARSTVADFLRPHVAAAQVFALCARLRPDVAHLHFFRAHSPLAYAAAATGAAVVVHDHVSLTPGSGARLVIKRATLGIVGRVAALRVPVSHFVARTIVAAEGAAPARVRVVHNGLQVERFGRISRDTARRVLDLPIDAAGTWIACVARLSRRKGLDVAVRAVARLPLRTHLLLVGDGPDRADLEQLAQCLGVADRVHFLGLRSDVETVLAACDQAWLPSRFPEPFGLAAVEAMASRLPMVASRTGGLPEVIEDGRSGFLVDIDDDAGLAALARRLIDAPQLARTVGDAARSRAEAEFGMARFVERVVAVYREACPAWASPARVRRAPVIATPRGAAGDAGRS